MGFSGNKQDFKAYRNGDKNAHDEFFNYFHRQLYLFCYDLIFQKEGSEEAVVEAFLHTWRIRQNIESWDAAYYELFKCAQEFCCKIKPMQPLSEKEWELRRMEAGVQARALELLPKGAFQSTP